jgi:hypothetical protein
VIDEPPRRNLEEFRGAVTTRLLGMRKVGYRLKGLTGGQPVALCDAENYEF